MATIISQILRVAVIVILFVTFLSEFGIERFKHFREGSTIFVEKTAQFDGTNIPSITIHKSSQSLYSCSKLMEESVSESSKAAKCIKKFMKES